MVFVDPVTRIGEKEFAYRLGVVAVEIERRAPVVGIASGEIGGRKLRQMIAVRADVVIDHIENNGNAGFVSVVDEAAEVVGPAI